jgi:diaminohydroxyphosphoribosylaminopyrimidine deaminase / 5-amino-6-(5-phosphoribosylamino)uracil reductase
MNTVFNENDQKWMHLALDWAKKSIYLTSPNPRVGCVIVKQGQLIGAGHTQAAGHDHAEIQALKVCQKNGIDPRGATVYVTLEPCSHFGRTPPCVNALIHAGVAEVVIALGDPNPRVNGEGLKRLQIAGITTRCGLFSAESAALNRGFLSRIQRQRPWVRLKMASSLDGISALQNGQSQWITGAAAREDGHHFRARACAILTGMGTVLADNPALTVRNVQTSRQPRKIILDSQLRLPIDAQVRKGADLWVIHAQSETDGQHFADKHHAQMNAASLRLTSLPDQNGHIDLNAVLNTLGQSPDDWAVNELHLETGPTLAGQFLQEHLVDELLIYVAPTLLGPGRPFATLPVLEKLSQRMDFVIHSMTQVGQDIRLRLLTDRNVEII